MPDRIIRSNILTSDAVNSLSWTAEIFYRRLMSVVDDFGRYDARSEILRSQLYPLKLDNVSKSDIVKWLNECSKAGLIRLYSTDGRGYLEILKFNQRLRAMKSKFPSPADKCGQMTADDSRPPREYESESETETESDTESETEERDTGDFFLVPEMQKLWVNNFPNYTTDKKMDYEALGAILTFMFSNSGCNDPTDAGTQEMALNTLQAVADEVKKETFWINKPLKSIAKNIQEFYNKIKNPQNAGRGKKDKPNADSLQQALNRRFQQQDGSSDEVGADAYKRTG